MYDPDADHDMPGASRHPTPPDEPEPYPDRPTIRLHPTTAAKGPVPVEPLNGWSEDRLELLLVTLAQLRLQGQPGSRYYLEPEQARVLVDYLDASSTYESAEKEVARCIS